MICDTLEVVFPPTNPGINMYLDFPGFLVISQQNTFKVLVPASRVNNNLDFKFEGVTAYMKVNTSDENRPLLGVYQVYSILSGDLSLPYTVRQR